MSKEIDQPSHGAKQTGEQEALEEALATRREFTRKFGNYAASAPVGMYLLMSPKSSSAQNSDGGSP